MKTYFIIAFTLLSASLMAQDYQQESIDYQIKLNADYKTGENSPLSPRDKDMFHALNFYEFNPEFIVEARFEKLDNTEELLLKTSTSRIATYTKYGYLYFTLKGVSCKLLVLSSPSLKDDPEYYNYLSVYFTDQTNGNGSYKVGRYMELRSPLKETVTLNFNNTYNPYCAYSKRYSCPVPPVENHLDVEITAGVQKGFR